MSWNWERARCCAHLPTTIVDSLITTGQDVCMSNDLNFIDSKLPCDAGLGDFDLKSIFNSPPPMNEETAQELVVLLSRLLEIIEKNNCRGGVDNGNTTKY